MTITRLPLVRLLLACWIFTCAASVAADFPPKEAVPISVPLYLDRRPAGMAQMLIMPNAAESYVQATAVLALLKDVVREEKLRALEAAAVHGFLALKDGTLGGVELRFDEARIALVVGVPSESKKLRSLKARREFDAAGRIITPPAAVAAYLNVFGAQNYVERDELPENEGRQPFRASTDAALNVRGWVLEASGDYIEDDARPWRRGDTRLVHDLPQEMVRAALGDLSYPVEGFQSFQPMLGLTVARNFDLQPYRVSEPTGRTSFFLNSPSRVEIYVNDRKVQTLQLGSGPFDMTDFPVVNGSNNVKPVITDATGRVEIKTFDIVSDANLLAAGLHKFAYNVGVISATVNREREYDSDRPVLSAFHRYGLTDSFTLGGNLQAEERQWMAGVDATVGSGWGVLRVDLAGSHVEDGSDGFAWQIQYQIVDRGETGEDGRFSGTRNFTLLTSYRSEHFAPLGLLQPVNVSSYQLAARYSRQWSPTFSAGISGNYRMGHEDQRDNWNYPTYRSGTFVRLGSDANVLLDGTLLYKDETPAALPAGSIRLVDEPAAAELTFFTNRAGRFRIEKLKPGRYVMQLYAVPGVTLPLVIPENAAGPTPAGVLTLPVTAQEP